MFQFDPAPLPICELRVIHCCCDPDRTWPSILVSDIQPPLDQPPSSRARLPRTCIRRYGAACDTAQRSRPPVGFTDRFSADRQKFWVAFCGGNQSASACTAPLMVTSSGDRPRPATWVKKPTLASTSYVPGLNSMAYRLVPNWFCTCWLNTVL